MPDIQNTPGTETGNQVIGKVSIHYGTVKAISPDGTMRILTLNSPVYADDRIITESDGNVSIVLDDPAQTQLDIGRMSDIILDEDVYGGAAPEDVAEAAAEIGAGDYLAVSENPDGTAKLSIFDSSHVEKGSVSFDSIDGADLETGDELNSLLGQVDVEDGT